MKLSVLPTECSCERCSSMCHSPCCGTADDMQALIDAGYENRLMFDDLPGGPDMLKPALKGYEGEKSPWQTSSEKGCTFWKEGKCELHTIGLKPTQGKLVSHDSTEEKLYEISEFICKSWETKKGKKVIEKWNEINE